MLISQKGFAPIIYIIIGIVVLTGGFASFQFISKNNTTQTNTPSPSPILLSPPPESTSSALPSVPVSSKPTQKPKPIISVKPSPTAKASSSSSSVPTQASKVTCNINTNVSSAWSPMTVYFSYSSSDQGKVTGQEWDLDGNGTWESQNSNTDWTYKDVGNYNAKLRLKLSTGGYSDTCSKTITVNSPKVTCNINASTTSGQSPLTVNFVYGAYFYGTNDYVTDVQWDFNGDGTWDTPYDYDSQHPAPYTYSTPGNYTAKMHLKTHNGMETDVCTSNITVN